MMGYQDWYEDSRSSNNAQMFHNDSRKQQQNWGGGTVLISVNYLSGP